MSKYPQRMYLRCFPRGLGVSMTKKGYNANYNLDSHREKTAYCSCCFFNCQLSSSAALQ